MKFLILHPDNTGLSPKGIQLRTQRMKQIAREDTEICMVCQTKTKIFVESPLDEAITSPEMICHAMEAERQGFDVIGLYCAEDPAIDAIRGMVSIPVVGAGQSSLQIAMGLGFKISWITSSIHTVYAENFIRKSGIDTSRLASVRSVPLNVSVPECINQTETIDMLEQCGRQCMRDGAHVLILGCLGFAGMGREVSVRLGIPVIDPAAALVAMAELLYYSGLCQSRIAYPKPAKQIRSWGNGCLS